MKSSQTGSKPRRVFAICNNLGLLPDQFFPVDGGKEYRLSPYLETDSTRVIALMLNSVDSPVLEVPGAEIRNDYHDLSHHGKAEAKLAQLRILDGLHMKLFAELLDGLKAAREESDTLLDRTMVLYGSNFGDANTHVTTNMPLILALFAGLVRERMKAGLNFCDAMIAGYTAVLVSPGFLFVDDLPGRLDDYALATRLALFLWNSEPDAALRARAARRQLRGALREETERMLGDPKSRRFVDAFLDYWIDARKVEATAPSATLYGDYDLDDALREAALAETQLFFADLIARDLPARNLIASDYTFLNERLARHYGAPGVAGAAMRRVMLPKESPRGGLMTQALVLKVTANGTTTSSVLRGKWIIERLLGYEIPPPPPVPTIEPDIRGAVTIRQQLDQHRADASCASCHRVIDPPGFALESFDVMGGWRDRYRAVAEDAAAVAGRTKEGHPFAFRYTLPVDAAGQLPDGRPFEFKKLLLGEEERVARNLVNQLLLYATGAPARFSDRAVVERILAQAKARDYGLRALIHGVVQSEMFLNK